MRFNRAHSAALAGCFTLVGFTLLGGALAQTAATLGIVKLPAYVASTQSVAQSFSFVSDGPIGPGWTRPDLIARTYFHEELPALFSRTITLSNSIPVPGKLEWIFTGPHAGFTVELSPTKLRVFQRYYDSSGLTERGQERIVLDDERQFTGDARTLTVVVDSHLAIQVLLNGVLVLKQSCVFDVIRHQLMFSAPRKEHLVLSGALLSTKVEDATIQVNPTEKHQVMLGFGGSPSIPAYAEMNEAGKRQYWELLRRYNLLLDREYPMGSQLKPDLSNLDDLRDATPHYYGDNFPNGEVSSFEYSKHALALGGEVIYEMWALPAWATQTYTSVGKPIIDAWGKPVLQAAKPAEYARIVVGYCRMAKLCTGSAPAVVGIENEVEQPPEVFAEMTTTLRRELDKAGFQAVKIHMADASYMYLATARAKALQQNAAAWRVTDYMTAHEYDFQKFMADPDLYDAAMAAMHDASAGKPFIATEICINDGKYQEPSYRIALNIGQLYQKNLTSLDAIAIMYCWLLLDVEQPNFGGSRSLLVPDKTNSYMPVASSFELRVLGAFSRHVFKGMTRVSSTSSNNDLLTVAFEDSHRASLIVLNRSTTPQRLNVQWTGEHWSRVERTSQTVENASSVFVPGDLLVQPGEILTLSTF
jgi:O-glycosyl hydrolase